MKYDCYFCKSNEAYNIDLEDWKDRVKIKEINICYKCSQMLESVIGDIHFMENQIVGDIHLSENKTTS